MKKIGYLLSILILSPMTAFAGMNYYLKVTNNTSEDITISTSSSGCLLTAPAGGVAAYQSYSFLWATEQSNCPGEIANITVNVTANTTGTQIAQLYLEGQSSNDDNNGGTAGSHCLNYTVNSSNSDYAVTPTKTTSKGYNYETANISIYDAGLEPSDDEVFGSSTDNCSSGTVN